MFTLEQFEEMCELQERLETRISGKDWRNGNHDYRLCIHMECAELIDLYPWKHWKAGHSVDLDEVAGELVDIWHFALAYILRNENFNALQCYEQFQLAITEYDHEQVKNMDMIDGAIGLGYTLYLRNQFYFGNFMHMCNLAKLSLDDLYQLYICKNVLNWFRQDNGYADGRYEKIWAGREDVEHMRELAQNLDEFDGSSLYQALETRYKMLVI